jgi:hypothetical protein
MAPHRMCPVRVPKSGVPGLVALALAAAGLTAALDAQAPKKPSKAAATVAQAVYFPDRFDWQKRTPAEAGMEDGMIVV